jgi:cation diffusion facilitator family transporter
LSSLSKQNLLSPEVCTRIGLWVNIGLAICKLAAGLIGTSQAMLADSVNSFIDVAATGAVLFGLRMARRPPDEDHPYGHGGIDTVVAVGVTLLLIATGAVIGLGAVRCLFGRIETTPQPIALYAAIVSIGVKEAMFRYTIKVGRRANSPSVIANAWDHRSDAYSSTGALVGIAGARLGFAYLDPVASIFIAYLIVRFSIKLLSGNIREIMHAAPPAEMIEQIRHEAVAIDGVADVRNIRVHKVGSSYFLDINIHVSGDMTVTEGHDVATLVKRHLRARVDKVSDVMVHVEPYSRESQ